MTGKREWPVLAARAMTSAALAPSGRVRTRPRSVMTSAAHRRDMRIELVNREAVDVSKVPSSALCSTRAASSPAERADEISSRGSIPMRLSTQLAVPPRTQMTGANTVVNAIWKGTTARAVSMGWASARFLGTSSPKSMEKTLMNAAAAKAATPVARPQATPADPSADSSSEAMVDWVV